MITRDFVKPGATVIDVGMNKVTDRAEFERLFAGNAKREETFRTKGSVLVGDVHPEVAEVAGAITPVPGGVGPLTIAMLMSNTVRAAKLRRGVPEPRTHANLCVPLVSSVVTCFSLRPPRILCVLCVSSF